MASVFTAPLGVEFPTAWARTSPARAIRHFCIDAIIRPGIHLLAPPKFAGRENFEKVAGPFVIAGNHASHVDTSLLLNAIPAPFRYNTYFAAAADRFYDNRLRAIWWTLTVGAVPVERTKVSRLSISTVTSILKDGYNVVIFPEGGRTADGQMLEFKPGAAFVATKAKVPIIPFYLEGTFEFMQKGKRVFTPHKTKVTFGEPIATEGKDPRELNQQLEAAVHRLAGN